MIIIPIGTDCALARFLKKTEIRTTAFPFDWAVSYNGVSECFKNNFINFTESVNNRINQYDMWFAHDFIDDSLLEHDREKFNRRCQRLIKILETSNEQVLFFRTGHASHHHREHKGRFTTLKNDIQDAEDLDGILQSRYPNLAYKIIVALICSECFNPSEIYRSHSNRIEIYNIAAPVVTETMFDNLCRYIFNV